MYGPQDLKSRIYGAIYGLAVCDALGAPVEFLSRGSFPKVVKMLPNGNFNLPSGHFTDDTSMALCLAHSLLENGGTTNTVDQISKYISWSTEGYMSSAGFCFDIGVATKAALSDWLKFLQTQKIDSNRTRNVSADSLRDFISKIDTRYNDEYKCGNGSLMRVIPTSLIALYELDARALARESSLPTHPHPRCLDSCEIYAILVYNALRGCDKETLADMLSTYFNRMKIAMIDKELWIRFRDYRSINDWNKKSVDAIRSTGYVIDSLEAALWAFFTATSFRDGAIKVVNLGDDADTVGAIYGGLSGAFYGLNEIPQDWLQDMKAMEKLETAAKELVQFVTTKS